jgi:hypothetical protein
VARAARVGLSPFELRDVSAARELDADVADRSAVGVVLVEPATQPPGLDADDRIEAGIVGGVPIRDKKDQRAWAAVDEPIKTDGYGFVKKSMTIIGTPNAEMEFAASLMTQGAVSAEHRARASAAAVKGSVLAINFARY